MGQVPHSLEQQARCQHGEEHETLIAVDQAAAERCLEEHEGGKGNPPGPMVITDVEAVLVVTVVASPRIASFHYASARQHRRT